MSAFFVSTASSSIPDDSDLKSPKSTMKRCYVLNSEHVTGGEYCGDGDDPVYRACLNASFVPFSTSSRSYYDMTCQPHNDFARFWYTSDKYDKGEAAADFSLFPDTVEKPSLSCPPDEFPDHTIEYKVGPNANDIMCAKTLVDPEDCPAGYHTKGASKALGSDSCLPNECPPAGSSESLFSSPTIGGSPFDGGGLYCNGGCTYNVNESQISLSKFAIGVSQGVACGDKPYENSKLANDANADQCTTTSDGTVTLLQCPDHHQPIPEDDPLDNSDSKVDDSKTPDKTKETCAEGDTGCSLKNVETEIENSINRLIDNDNELHNKKIDADTKNAKAFLNIMESIDTAILLQTSQDERLHAVTVGKFNELVDAVNGIEAGGGGGGGGNGTGNGNIGGQDCEGTIEECSGIGTGDGVELPTETLNLNQYADKYDDWLPNAELPEEKCVTLTNGKTLCFTYKYIILIFQAISGLLVISALIHSGKIIAGSF
ncbi:hypothetical protein [Pseudoalteromonas lipolytica]|nr:hypothetical protein [Pseudoalteromonas lipolytica]